ncbi:MAG: mechanosensitive ion channel protein MscS [Pseudopedobacter saltans]|uniref:Mechanosensitive ion channel protein MscS n=1 Tax=Pseudopedobacter saltans TaxID=151895 RepID=A0A2W5END4_9SPHI|nr:MAG: mechanosensitive ion channel protein MscS [Pseudopedobacter saltans]
MPHNGTVQQRKKSSKKRNFQEKNIHYSNNIYINESLYMKNLLEERNWRIPNWPVWLNNLLVVFIIATISIGIGWAIVVILRKIIKRTAGKKGRFILYHNILSHWTCPVAVLIPLLISFSLINNLTISDVIQTKINKIYSVAFTITTAWLLISAVYIIEAQLLSFLNLKKDDNLKERKAITQLQFVKRILIGIIALLTISVILINFDSLRQLGDTLLKSVGIGSLIIGFAAQKSLANLLAGFQIAFTQPLRIDDVLIVEGEWGRVEEITLTYVVLKIWDERRLILPIQYFIEKPFQNWTRSSSDILGTVFLYTDFAMPIEPIREEFKRLLQTSAYWDERVNVVHVTDLSKGQKEIRLLMSANTSSHCFELRAFVRENIIAFISEHYPNQLIRTRIEMLQSQKEDPMENMEPSF